MNKIIYGNYTFTDTDILSANLTLANAMVSESLSADEFKFTVYSTQTSNYNYLLTVLQEYYTTVNNEHFGIYVGALQNYTYGTPVYYYKDNVLQGKYYVSNVTRSGTYTFDFECVSAVGLLIKVNHKGGVYENSTTTVGSLIREIFTKIGATENTDYIIDNAIDSVPVNGWLPYASCRDNLRQILFAIGASITKTDEGILIIKYISSPTLINLPDDKIYQGGGVNYIAPCSKVEVWEHEYHKLSTDELVVLFDNTNEETATNELITFSEPCHPNIQTGNWVLTGTLTYSDIGSNYAVVSGVGTLSGYKYTHTTRVMSQSILGAGTEQIAEVKDATLVSTLNSKNATKRVAKYYSQAKEISCDVVVDGTNIKPSSKVSFTNPFGESTTGYVKDMNVTVSGINKSNTTIVTDWTPSNFGNNYNNYVVVSNGTTWTPTFTGDARLILIGGGNGGNGGVNGASGENSTLTSGTPSQITAENGAYGNGGNGGNGGKILTVDVSVTQGTTYNLSIGQGGTGGTSNGGTGGVGGDTTITIGGTTYTSANGTINDNGHVNTFTGDVYGLKGWNGVKGGNSQPNHNLLENYTETTSLQIGLNEILEITLQSGNRSTLSRTPSGSYLGGGYGYGTNGGGGALGTNGGNATEPQYRDMTSYDLFVCASGGNGANAMSTLDYLTSIGKTLNLSYGQGGLGGNGGGSGAGAGNGCNASSGYSVTYAGSGGTGGTSTSGTNGQNGVILIYY